MRGVVIRNTDHDLALGTGIVGAEVAIDTGGPHISIDIVCCYLCSVNLGPRDNAAISCISTNYWKWPAKTKKKC